ncbi:DUF1003 domain-containing protein [Liquorilactobacillus satsumensis]|nr:DUF1003 domain-containing protein [Liquorilactobacillus satsumensis]MCP9312414.1 DUF1003 domain-containing protein [Liquorilactobacillus satsumensis]MCP9359582.1 DUF1003 domain-containing protein [Liquorilactobacillus satsumensis]
MNKIDEKNEDYQIKNVNNTFTEKESWGDRVADAVARFGGSWSFIISFCIVLFIWMALNVVHLFGVRFDPYPFILLNLFLSCVAALQAPIIMMSQNRQAARDHLDAENDYHTNIVAERRLKRVEKKLEQQSRKIDNLLELLEKQATHNPQNKE